MLKSLLAGPILIPIIFFFIEFPKGSLASIISGIAIREIFFLFRRTSIFNLSELFVLIYVETSKMLSTLLLFIPIIISFFFSPAFSAGLLIVISSIFG